MADDTRWSDARQDYITSSLSYRQIAEKYGLCKRQLDERASKEKWVEKRRQYIGKASAKKENIAAEEEAKRFRKTIKCADDLTDEIFQAMTRAKKSNKPLSSSELKNYASALKDLKIVQGLRSTAEAREQDARIANLERQATQNEEDKTTSVVVRIAGGTEDWGC